MSLGNEIIISSNPKGVFLEGIISGTPKPGTVVQIVAATEPVSGRFTWQVFDAAADGDQRIVAILLPDSLQGKLATAAYVTGDRCFMYCPIMGEELNMLVKTISGTSDSWAIGDLLIVDDATGKLVATTGSPESEPFIMLETVAELTDTGVDTLRRVMYSSY